MGRDVFVHVVRDFLEHVGGVVHVTGGEPTVHPGFEFFMGFLRSYGARVVVATNGLNPYPIIDTYYDGVTVQVSLDGDEYWHEFLRGRGTYRRVVETLGLLERRGIPVVIRCVLHRDNFHVVNHVLSFLDRFENVTAVYFNAYVPVENSPVKPLTRGQFSKLAKISNALGMLFPPNYMYGRCYAGELFVYVTPDGLYLDCPYIRGVLGSYPEPVHKLYTSVPEGRVPPCLERYLGGKSGG